MNRFTIRLAELCRRRAAEHRFLRRFRMMVPDEDERCGPGWFESSRELERGLLVREGEPGGPLLAQWLEAARQPADDAQRSRATASPSSITASA